MSHVVSQGAAMNKENPGYTTLWPLVAVNETFKCITELARGRIMKAIRWIWKARLEPRFKL